MLDSVLKVLLACSNTEGKYAYACGSTWADAKSFAGAAYKAYTAAWADVQTNTSVCNCGTNVYAQADVVTSAWGEIWSNIYAALDDSACASSYNDQLASNVDKEKLLECTGTVIVRAAIPLHWSCCACLHLSCAGVATHIYQQHMA